MGGEFRFDFKRLTQVLGLVAILLVAANIVAITILAQQEEPVVERARWVILDFEANLPTWFSTMLLAIVAVLFRIHAGAASRRESRYWNALAILFVVLSIDESISMHEMMTDPIRAMGARHLFHFAWVIPALAGLVVLTALIGPFLWRLPDPLRRRLFTSAVVFVSGAIGFEMIGGWWSEQHGTMNAIHGAIMTCEETMEITGLWLAVRALAADVESVTVRLRAGAGG